MEIRTYTVDTYKDIPVPYAIFKIIYADDGNVANTQYVYVNEAYCQTAGKTSSAGIFWMCTEKGKGAGCTIARRRSPQGRWYVKRFTARKCSSG